MLNDLMNQIADRLLSDPHDGVEAGRNEVDEKEKLRQALGEAREEWRMAQDFFDSASSPELVDCAVYQVTAAEKKYTYLLREAKRRGLEVEDLKPASWS